MGIVLIAGAIGGAFLGGEAVGNNNAKTTLAQAGQNLIGQFGANGPGQFGTNGIPQQGGVRPGGVIPGGAGAGFAGVGAVGTVQNIAGNIVTVTTQNGSPVSVVLSSNTTIEKMTQGTAADITVGGNVTIAGPRNTDGSIQAATVLIN